jgi:hypothetical protein
VEILVGHSIGLRGLYTDPDALPMKEAVDLIPPMGGPQPATRCRVVELGASDLR